MTTANKIDIKLIKAQGGNSHQLFIYNEIGLYGYSKDDLIFDLSQLNGEPLDVHIASLGGLVADGIAIYNCLVDYPGKVTTYADSIVASIASVIFMAGDERLMADNSSLMIHKPEAPYFGNSDGVDAFKQQLLFFNGVVVKSYMRAGLSDEQAQDLINQDNRWIDATEAVELNLATGIREGLRAVAALDMSEYEGVPDWVTDNYSPHQKKTTKSWHSNVLARILNSSRKSDSQLTDDAAASTTQEDVEMTDQNQVSAEELASAVANASAEATANATKRYHEIISCEEAKGRDKLAAKLAANASISVEDAKEILAESPKQDHQVEELSNDLEDLELKGGAEDQEQPTRVQAALTRRSNRK